MSKQKYPRDEKGNVILGTQYGITITRPWSNEMYKHNDAVAIRMKRSIMDSASIAYAGGDDITLKIIFKEVASYGIGSTYSIHKLYDILVEELEKVENFWLHDWAWPELVKQDIVKPIETAMVGYDKIN